MSGKFRNLNLRTQLAALILLVQVCFIVHARFDPARYFCWAMFHSFVEYQIQATMNGKELSAVEINARYGRKAIGVDPHSIQHIKDVIVQRERGPGQPVHVRLVYRTNGKSEQEWVWVR